MSYASHADYAMVALCVWREDRSGQTEGMTAVACVIRNRVARDKSTYFDECTRRWQFSSLTAMGDPELTLYPTDNDPTWEKAQMIAEKIIDGEITDITGGATSYYALSIPTPPSWASTMIHTVDIGGQTFFK